MKPNENITFNIPLPSGARVDCGIKPQSGESLTTNDVTELIRFLEFLRGGMRL